jgi:hypothetical protein
MYKSFLFIALLALLVLPCAAQEIDIPTPDSDGERAMNRVMVSRVLRTVFEEDPSGFFMFLLANEQGESLFPGSKKEFGFTEEQVKRFEEYMEAAEPENFKEFAEMFEAAEERISNNPNDDLTEEEDAALNSMFKYTFEATNGAAKEAFTDEQIQKVDGMMLAMTGGLESPFFNNRHMSALDMTDAQKEQFKKINEDTKPERDKMIAEFSADAEKMFNSGKFSFTKLTASLSKFREYQKTLKQRRSAVLTEAQLARVKTLAKAPKFMSVFNLLPVWTPGPNSWQPGDPLPPEAMPLPKSPGRFPKPKFKTEEK